MNEPLLGGNEKRYLDECVDSGWISSEGPFVAEFEKRFAYWVGRRHGIAVCNGSAALDAAVAALGIGPGDEVVMPSFTIISCAASVVRAGAVPVVDSDPATWNMDASRLEESVTARTRAIMAVHTYGLPVDMDVVERVAARHGLAVIEDAAEAHGLRYGGRSCGSFGDLSCFSFYPNKLVTSGEGGMIVTDDDALAERCRGLRNLCFQRGRRFVHEELGWNFRMTNLQAAVGLAQLEQAEGFIQRKRRMGARYLELLEGIPGIRLPLAATEKSENIFWVFGLVLDDGLDFDAAEAARRLGALGVGTRPFFWPMHEQPVLRRMGFFEGVRLPVAERLARRGLYLPSGLALTEEQMLRVAGACRKVFGG